MRDYVNAGNWSLFHSCTDQSLLIKVIIEFVRAIEKPLFDIHDLLSMDDMSISIAIDHSHLGILTGLSELV